MHNYVRVNMHIKNNVIQIKLKTHTLHLNGRGTILHLFPF